ETDWSHNKVLISIVWGLLLLLLSLVINYFAGTYATAQAGATVSDIILDHIPVVDLSGIFIYGIIAFFTFVVFLLIKQPKRAPFVLKSLSVFIIVRAFFVSLTHIGPAQLIIPISPDNIISYFTFEGDLFFSGHTGLPFLMALIFWEKFWLRNLFLYTSVLFGMVVLLGRWHYSIDVFAAFFITYGIFKISTTLFKKEFHLLNSVK
ncbi:MAG: phosphatase PAP2-related protein, partial [Patescibacteria group bacterium]